MKTTSKVQLLSLVLISLLLAGCKIRIAVPEGGSVVTESGRYECPAGQECTIDVSHVYFDETFVARPDPGYRFLGWRKRDKALCGGREDACRLTTKIFPGFDSLMAILRSDEVWHLTPVFGCEGNPEACYQFRVTGDEEIVFDWSVDSCETWDIPDLPARAFRDAAGNVQLIVSHPENRRMIGPSLDELKHDCNVIMGSHYDADPSQYNDHEWIAATYTTDGIKIHALLHNEYRGHSHPGMCPSGNYFYCWYNALTYASSEDMGKTYTHALAPAHLVATLPYEYVPGEGPYGIFEGSNIVRNPKDGFYYRVVRTQYRGKQTAAVMRTQTLDDPASWRCWDGAGFNISFVNPYHKAELNPADHLCAPISAWNIGSMYSSLTYNRFVDKFLLISSARNFDDDGSGVPGIFFSFSDDLIHWSPRKRIVDFDGMAQGDRLIYPSAIDPDDQSWNFEFSDQDMYIYFTRWRAGTDTDRDLVRIPVKITVERSDARLPQGYLDGANCNQIFGWSWDADAPNQSLQVAIYDVDTQGTERLITTVLANGYRPDLEKALGDNGMHGFGIQTPPQLRDGLPHTIRAYGINPDPRFPRGALYPPAGKQLQCP